MKTILIPILFALATALFWGSYGPTIGNAKSPVPLPAGGWTPFKPYVFIGIAYVVWAIAGGLLAMKLMGDNYSYSAVVQDGAGADVSHWTTAKFGFYAGTLGALGALCLTSAMMLSRGNSLLVMPIVFGGAVSVTAIIEVIRHRDMSTVNPLLWVGVATVVIGIVLVATNTPHGAAAHSPRPAADSAATPAAAASEHAS
jgi:hypothetical protein